MTPIGDLEIQSQRPVIALLRDHLGCKCLGDWHEREETRRLARRAGTRGVEMRPRKP